VKIGICGGGPAGLYFAILMKRADPGHEITVFERNPPGATYGWGVVFSDESLGELRDADYETYLAIDEALVRWSAIDTYYRGERIRSTGHGFAAIARTALLGLLRERAAGLGVSLRFEQPVETLEALAGCGFDLVVGADGVRSVVRDAPRSEQAFGTSLSLTASRYIWYGADVALPVFTFIFRPTEFGLFQVHAYPYDAHRSTFIVECMEPTWLRAGLDAMSEAGSLALCQDLFGGYLGGGRLMSKSSGAPTLGHSGWSRFVTVRNRSWHDGNVVLMGDAAHTAHFSIGSGTRLAMDDAIGLAKAFVEHPGDLEAAFAAYEGERQPIVERFQEVASDSARYFESVERYLGFDPEQFTFNLLTRGRISHNNLEARDPALVNRVQRVFAGAPAERLVVPPPVLVPLRLSAGCELANRVVLAPAPLDEAVDGLPGELLALALEAAAGTGAGLVMTEPVAVLPEGRVTSGSAGLWTGAQASAWAEIVERVHALTTGTPRARGSGTGDTRLALRLSHAGRRGATLPRRRGLDRPLPAGGWRLAAPSPLAYTSRSRRPEEMDAPAMESVRAAFAAAAGRAAGAGVDVLLLDLADGYLLASFLSPLTNLRTDDYGGDLAARARFPLEVLEAVQAAWPAERPLAVRLVADDRMPGGLTPADGVELARLLAAQGVALVDVAAGHTAPDERAAADYRRLFNVGLVDRVRNEAGVTALAAGHITRLDEVNTILAAGRADLVTLDPRLYLSNRRANPAPCAGFERQEGRIP
jgi:anthraniloyl-CoA monooxygenase